MFALSLILSIFSCELLLFQIVIRQLRLLIEQGNHSYLSLKKYEGDQKGISVIC